MVTEKETAQTEIAKPKIEDSPEFKEALQLALRQGTSKYQQQAAEAKRETKKLSSQINLLTEQMNQAKRDAEVARLAGDDVDAAEKVREQIKFRDELDKRVGQLTEREERVQELEKRASIRLLHEEYGIPVADLEEFETLAEMEIAALKYERDQLKKAKPSGKAKPEEEERESKSLDTAEGRLGSTKVPPAGTKEFEEFYSKVRASFSR